MSKSPIDTIDTLLENAIKETEDTEVNFKLRTSCQLLDAIRNEHDKVAETLEGAELDDDLRNQLQELGYIE